MKKIGNLIMIVGAFLMLLPIFATIIKSLENGVADYEILLFDCFPFYRAFWNSVIYAVTSTLFQLVVAVLCAFGFTQLQSKWKNISLIAYVIIMMMPLQVTILPNYIGLRDLGLINTPLSIILPSIFSPLGVVIMYQYMKNLDVSVIEATRLETNSVLKAIWVAVIPQMKACIFAVGLFIFADCWNMLEQPMLFLKNEKLQTLSMFIANSSNYEGEVLFPAAVIFAVPVLLLFFKFNEHLEKGLTWGDLL